MVRGAPTTRYATIKANWQLYEVTGLGLGQTAQITKVNGQPNGGFTDVRDGVANQGAFNNIAPFYLPDGRIGFVSDAPRGGASAGHLYPLLDEYENGVTVGGIWTLRPDAADPAATATLIEDAPSGAFSPFVDSFGRIIFTKWDHLRTDGRGQHGGTPQGAINFAGEAPTAQRITRPTVGPYSILPAPYNTYGDEFFPESSQGDFDPACPLASLNLANPSANCTATGKNVFLSRLETFVDAYGRTVQSHDFNHFFPWMMFSDGSGEETLNHVGRHEWGGSFMAPTFVGDTSLTYLNPHRQKIANQRMMAGSAGMFQTRQDPLDPRRFCGVYSLEFKRAATGNIICVDGHPETNPDAMAIANLTSRGDLGAPDTMTAPFGYRDPLMMTSGVLVASVTPYSAELIGGERYVCAQTRTPSGETVMIGNEAVAVMNLSVNYDLHLATVVPSGGVYSKGTELVPRRERTIRFMTGSGSVDRYVGPLWELQPVEVAPRPVPQVTSGTIPAIEAALIAEVLSPRGLALADLVAWLKAEGLSLIVGRNMTSRDRGDRAQPYNLEVVTRAGVHGARTVASDYVAGTTSLYDITALELFQGDRIRGYDGALNLNNTTSTTRGRRILAVPMHDETAITMNHLGTPPPAGAANRNHAPLFADGSFAAFVPAGRALSWQLVGSDGRPQIRERNWVSFAPGEVRVCASCHGANTADQAGGPPPTNSPDALRALLQAWAAAR